MNSVLTGRGPDDVTLEPFPHLVLEPAVDDETSMQLLEQFPPLEVVAEGAELGSNSRFSLKAHLTRESDQVSALWKEFVARHVSPEFLSELVSVFGPAIRGSYPDFESKYGQLEALRLGLRGVDSFDTADILLDCQISVNTPVTARPDSVRRAHLDDPNKLFAALFYLRHPDDDSTGGDLEICVPTDRPRGFRGPLVYDRFVKPVRTVKYQRGTLVMFLNTADSLHGVTVRSRTDVPRYFVNFVAEVKDPLFSWDAFQATKADKLIAAPEILKRKLMRVHA